jgi:hypothetical protein
MGKGPMTGRGAGYCSGSNAPGFAWGCGVGRGRGFGPGFGAGYGAGRGRRNRFFAGAPQGYAGPQEMDPAMEKQALANQAEALQAQLDAIRKRLTEME